MTGDILSAFVEKLKETPPELEPVRPPDALPDEEAGYRRGLKVIDAPQAQQAAHVSIKEARDRIWEEMNAYARLVRPEHMLLIKAVPGVGKTTAAVRLAEELAAQGRRVLYAAPRHNFIHDLRAIAQKPHQFYEWLPRQKGGDPDPETCLYTDDINRWLHRGYDGLEFCSRICQWEYVNKQCVYHRQKQRTEPIIMGQHQHLLTGHPIPFQFVIGDESPLATFQHQWLIPARWILPPGMDATEPLAEVLHELRRLAETDTNHEGDALIAALGGPQRVLDACESFSLPATVSALSPLLNTASDSKNAPFFHLPKLLPLLAREAEAVRDGHAYPHRIIAGHDQLMLLLRHEVSEQMPRHIVWLDATGNAHLYEAAFRRPVKVVEPQVKLRGRIVQVTDRANGKSSLVRDGEATDKVEQTAKQIRHIIAKHGLQKPGIITFQDMLSLADLDDVHALHFYAARGTNVQEHVDGHIVVGTPQPSILEMDKLARMLFFERMMPFNKAWSTRDVSYHYADTDGKGRAYSVSGFWHDPDLQAVLWQYREAELIQAAHRSRLAIRDVTVWLLTNLPVWELPPAELLQIRELFGAPEGVDAFRWQAVLTFVRKVEQEHGHVTATQLIDGLGLNKRTAYKYMDALLATGEWEPAIVTRKGRPPKAMQKAHAQP